MSQVNGRLPLLKVLELESGARPVLEYQGDVVGTDGLTGEDAVADRRQGAEVGEVHVNGFPDACSFRLHVFVDGVEECGLPYFRLVVLVGACHEGFEECTEIVGH